VIAKETARMLGLGTNIPDAAGLPTMDADGKIPKDLAQKYGQMMIEADGFAQVGLGGEDGPLRLGLLGRCAWWCGRQQAAAEGGQQAECSSGKRAWTAAGAALDVVSSQHWLLLLLQ
jgi:hypothetical protein